MKRNSLTMTNFIASSIGSINSALRRTFSEHTSIQETSRSHSQSTPPRAILTKAASDDRGCATQLHRSAPAAVRSRPPLITAKSEPMPIDSRDLGFLEIDADEVRFAVSCDDDETAAALSSVLRTEHLAQLQKHLPSRLLGTSWRCTFNTEKDGFSLHSIYRKFPSATSTTSSAAPSLLAVLDRSGVTFGAFNSAAFHVQELFYGDGQCFLFSISGDQVNVYKWTGKNSYFVRSTNEGLEFGASEGHFGLFLDEGLDKGRTESCETFNNPPLTPEKDFEIRSVEVWTFDD